MDGIEHGSQLHLRCAGESDLQVKDLFMNILLDTDTQISPLPVESTSRFQKLRVFLQTFINLCIQDLNNTDWLFLCRFEIEETRRNRH